MFDSSLFKESPLEKLSNNTELTVCIIPTFEIMFREDNGYGVYICEDENEDSLKIQGGFVSPLTVGQTYEVQGKVVTYRGEKQLSVKIIKNVKPYNKKGIILYLQTLRGLKSKAQLIFDKYGAKSIDMLIENPLEVAKEIKGIGKKSVLSWASQLENMKESQHTITTLLNFGLTPKQAKVLYDYYKDKIVERIRENPYFLAREVRGYGFEKCDKIARSLGYDPRGAFRLQEGIIHILKEATQDGHCFLPIEELVKQTIDLLNIRLTVNEMRNFAREYVGKDSFDYVVGDNTYQIDYKAMVQKLSLYDNSSNIYQREYFRYIAVPMFEHEILTQIKEIESQNRIVIDDDNVYLTNLYEAEIEVAERIVSLAEGQTFEFTNLEEDLDELLNKRGIRLESKQREAVLSFAKGRGGFHILNGSAGCGKTFTLKIILELLELQYKKKGKLLYVKVFAPTGKASKVASKATGRECMTVHRGLGYNPAFGFEYNERNPLDADCIVVDESSMMDIILTRDLLRAISAGTKVVFLGDTKQLPSVGAGNVLHDLIESHVVNVITLDVVKRQGEKSGVIRNANHIINDEMLENCHDTKDAYVIHRETVWGVQKVLIESMNRILSMDEYGIEDVQVLCPQKTSLIGTYLLNYLLQQEFNHNKSGLKVLNRQFDAKLSKEGQEQSINLFFRKGDKVIHVKNNYDMEWYVKTPLGYKKDKAVGITNGECGIIEDIEEIKTSDGMHYKIIVRYEEKYVFYEDGVEELEHAWALTFHKSQGSQWKAVLLPIMHLNRKMLDNNLLYTGYTRAESFNVVVGQQSAIEYAIKTHKSRKRYTGLTKRIVNAKKMVA